MLVMGDGAGVEVTDPLPVSPAIFVPEGLSSPPPLRWPWLAAIAALAGLCLVLAFICFLKLFHFTVDSGIAWRSWPFAPLAAAALRPLPVLGLLALVLVPRRVP